MLASSTVARVVCVYPGCHRSGLIKTMGIGTRAFKDFSGCDDFNVQTQGSVLTSAIAMSRKR